jgi:hypothetical protein
LTFTQSDGTLARVSISGTDVAESSTDSTTTYRFDGTFSSTGGQSQGVPSSGTATGEIVVDRDGATLTTSLTLSAS